VQFAFDIALLLQRDHERGADLCHDSVRACSFDVLHAKSYTCMYPNYSLHSAALAHLQLKLELICNFN